MKIKLFERRELETVRDVFGREISRNEWVPVKEINLGSIKNPNKRIKQIKMITE